MASRTLATVLLAKDWRPTYFHCIVGSAIF
jgi:hypothetical protein